MKICEYHPRISYYVGGGEFVVIDQIRRLSNGNEVTIVTSQTDNKTEQFIKLITECALDVIFFNNPLREFQLDSPSGKVNKWDLESIFLGEETRSFFEGNKFDLVITHYSVDNLLLPKEVNNVLHLHGVPPHWKRIDELSVRNTNNFVSVADFVARGWNELYGLGNVVTCYNGIDVKKFHDKNLERDIDVLYIGRMVPYKRLDVLIDSLRDVKDLKVVIAGGGAEKRGLEKRAKDYGLNIDFAGYVPDNEIVDYYNRAKIFVHTADTREGVVTTMLEAMACGAIPIVSASCGMLEAITHFRNGFLFEPLNAGSLSRMIRQVHGNCNNYSQIRENAKRTIIERFDCDKTFLQLDSLYKKFAGKEDGK